MDNEGIELTARCSSHHSLEQLTVCFASFHPRPVALFFNSINHVYSFFILSNLFFNCFFVCLSPIFSSYLDLRFFPSVPSEHSRRPIPSLYLSFTDISEMSHIGITLIYLITHSSIKHKQMFYSFQYKSVPKQAILFHGQ